MSSSNYKKVSLGVLIIAAWLIIPTTLLAEMVSIAKENVNMRSGPGSQYKVMWKLAKGYPLIILTRKDKWAKVKDFEDDQGWVYLPMTSKQPHLIVKKESVNIRSGPGQKHPVISDAKHGVVFQTLVTQGGMDGWAKIKHEKTGVVGWVRRDMLWGW